MAVQRKFVREAVNRLMIREFLEKETERAGFGGIQIQRTPMGTRVSILAERPGMVIGRKGSTINMLTESLSKRYKVENPQIEVVEAGRNASLNAQIMAIKLAEALERGWHFRRAGHSTVQRVMQSGAKGCQVIISGKLTGQRHRTEKFQSGHLKYCGDTKDKVMDIGFAVCKKKLGVMGCTVRIMRPDAVLPDNITIFTPEQAAANRAKAPAQPAAAAEMAPPPAKPPEAKPEPEKKPRAPRVKKEPAPKEATEPAPKEPAKETAKAAPKEAPKPAPKEAPKPAPKEAPKEDVEKENVPEGAVAGGE